jgi:hypothetical protein
VSEELVLGRGHEDHHGFRDEDFLTLLHVKDLGDAETAA